MLRHPYPIDAGVCSISILAQNRLVDPSVQDLCAKVVGIYGNRPHPGQRRQMSAALEQARVKDSPLFTQHREEVDGVIWNVQQQMMQALYLGCAQPAVGARVSLHYKSLTGLKRIGRQGLVEPAYG